MLILRNKNKDDTGASIIAVKLGHATHPDQLHRTFTRVHSGKVYAYNERMTLPIRNLPLVQNWDCQSCGDCCRELEAVITEEEKRRIEELDLANDAEIGRGPWFKRHGWRS